MPATIRPPGASTGRAPEDSTRHSASAGAPAARAPRRAARCESTAAIASRVKVRHQNFSAPSGSETPGNSRAPLETTLSAPSDDALADARSSRRSRSGRRSARRRRRCSRAACSARRSTAPAITTALSIVVPSPTVDAVLEHRAPADRARPAPIRQPLSTSAAGTIRPVVGHAVLDAHVRRAHARADLGAHVALEDVEGRLEVALGRPDVLPVAVRRRGRTARCRPAAGRRRARSRPARPCTSSSSTERSSTYTPAEMLFVSIWSGAGFSTNSRHRRRRRRAARGRRRSGPRPGTAPSVAARARRLVRPRAAR